MNKGAALVTGASARIGLTIARRLAGAGWAVVLHASVRSLPAAEAEAARLVSEGARAHALAADLAEATSCGRLIEQATAAFGPLRLLVNNAAIFEADDAGAPDLDVWERQFAVNLRAPVLLAAAFASQVPDGGEGCIVNLIDQRVLRPSPRYFSYTLAKSALWTATCTMAQSFAARGIRVNAVGPGPVLPNDLEGDEGFRREVEGVPLRRAVTPDEVAAAVLYLAEARAVTGQFLAVDSGQHIGWRTPDVMA